MLGEMLGETSMVIMALEGLERVLKVVNYNMLSTRSYKRGHNIYFM